MDLRKMWIVVAGVTALIAMTAGQPVLAEDAAAQGEPSMEEQMAAWAKYASPGPEHEFLAKMAGQWKATAKMWMQPGAPPMETHGSAKNEMVLDGRFLKSEYTGQMMEMPFKGMGLDGFDKQKQKYVSTWMDTMGTMMMIFEGSADAEGKVRTLTAEFKDPLTGKMKKMKSVTRIVSNNEHVFEGYEVSPKGDAVKMMEITFTRQ